MIAIFSMLIAHINKALIYPNLISYFFYLFYDARLLAIPLCNASIYRTPWALLGFGLTLTYNGERGKQNKMLGYWFYPVHLLFLGILRFYLKR